MRNRDLRKVGIGASIAFAALFVFSSGAPAQAQRPAAAQPKTSTEPFDPRDFSGLWGVTGGGGGGGRPEEPPMTAWGLAKYKLSRTNTSDPPATGADDNDPILRCEPPGIPRLYSGFVHPISFMMDKDKVVELFETDSLYRVFHFNRQHPEHPDAMWYGDSIAHWEGNTLVVDTTDFNDRSWLDVQGHPHSDKLHLLERFSRPDHDHLQIDMTIDDPIAYTKPWNVRKMWKLDPKDWELTEYECSPTDEAEVINKVMEPESVPKK
jgi:hypothetical protein